MYAIICAELWLHQIFHLKLSGSLPFVFPQIYIFEFYKTNQLEFNLQKIQITWKHSGVGIYLRKSIGTLYKWGFNRQRHIPFILTMLKHEVAWYIVNFTDLGLWWHLNAVFEMTLRKIDFLTVIRNVTSAAYARNIWNKGRFRSQKY